MPPQELLYDHGFWGIDLPYLGPMPANEAPNHNLDPDPNSNADLNQASTRNPRNPALA